jgi:multiple sugar transport system substrate-binding protein
VSAAEEEKTVTIWTWDYDNTLMMADAFHEVYPNINVEVVNVAFSDYFTKIQQAVSSGSELPDIVAQSCTLLKNYGELGIFEDLSQEPYNVDSDVFFDYIKDRAIMDDGSLIGIEESVNPSAIAYKRDLALEYFGTDDPDELAAIFADPSDYITYGKEVQEKSDGEVYLFHSAGAVAEWLYFAQDVTLEQDGVIHFTDKMKEPLELLCEMRDNNVVDTYENGTPQANATYSDDQHIMYPCPNWAINYYIKANDEEGSGNWGLMMPATGGYSCGGTSLGITNTSECKEEAWEFIHWCLMTKDGAEMMRDKLNFFVPTTEFYEDPDFVGGADEFFGGQDIGSFLYGDIASSIATLNVSKYDQTVIDIRDLLAVAIMDDDSMTAEDALAKGLEEAQMRILDMDVE